jgi:hypothetical protein
MPTDRNRTVSPNTSADQAPNRPAGLPRRQRIGLGLAGAVISGVLLGGVVLGMADTSDGARVMAGEAGTGRISAA